MSSPQSARSEREPPPGAAHSESTEAEENSFSVTGSDAGDLESDVMSVSLHSMSQYDEEPLNYMGNRRSFAKKQTIIINKLKSELAQARNTIAMSKVNDILILKSKLRAAEVDLNRARIQNIEFKEDIERLELRLFELLSNNTQKTSQRPQHVEQRGGPRAPADAAAEANSAAATHIAEDSEARNVDTEKQSSAGHKNDEIWLLKRKPTKLDGSLLSLPDHVRKDIQDHIAHSIERASEADRKTISELVKELHRVEEDIQRRDSVNKCDCAKGTDIAEPSSEQDGGNGPTNVSVIRKVEREYQFSQRDLLFSFFVGAMLMLFSVVVSAVGTISDSK